MKQLCEYMSEYSCDREILIETCNLIINDMINESFKASILLELAKKIKDAEKSHSEDDKKNAERYKEKNWGTPSKSAKSFASIFGPITETGRYGGKKTGIQGIKWSEIKDDDFTFYEADTEEWDKKFIKTLRSMYGKKLNADVICCKPGTKEVVAFIKGYGKTEGDVKVYNFPTTGWKKGVQEMTATKYKFGERSLKFQEAIDAISGLDVYVLEIKDSMIEDYDVLHKEREKSQEGVINLDKSSLDKLLKQQQGRYKALVKEIKAKKLQDDPNILFNEIKKTNDDVIALYQKVIEKPENMDQRLDLDDLMRYVSYAYEQFYKSMKYKRDAERSVERAREKGDEKPERWGEYDRENSDESIRDAKEYVQKVKKMISEIEENLK